MGLFVETARFAEEKSDDSDGQIITVGNACGGQSAEPAGFTVLNQLKIKSVSGREPFFVSDRALLFCLVQKQHNLKPLQMLKI